MLLCWIKVCFVVGFLYFEIIYGKLVFDSSFFLCYLDSSVILQFHTQSRVIGEWHMEVGDVWQ